VNEYQRNNMQSNHMQVAIGRLSDASKALGLAAQALQLANPVEMPLTRSATGRSPAERLSGKQLSAVRMACRRGNVSAEKLAELVAQVSDKATDIVELSRAEASALLSTLDEMTGYQR
jgi:hypothetical protein